VELCLDGILLSQVYQSRSICWVDAVESLECASILFEYTVLEFGGEVAVEDDVKRFGREVLEEVLECLDAEDTAGFLPGWLRL